MNTTSWSRKQFRQLAGAGALVMSALLTSISSASAQQTNAPAKPAEADSPELNNWVDVGLGGSFVSGDKAQFQHQSGLPANMAFGGINAFHYELPIGKKGQFTADGRGIFDNHDYDLRLEVSHPDIGYVRAGVRQYREYYDGSGGYLPSNGAFNQLPNNELALDRGTAYFEGDLKLPDWPELKIRYEHDFRSGSKDSTEWGQLSTAAVKKISPAFRLLDEKTDTISADVGHTIKNTELGLGLRYQWINNTDSQNITAFPNVANYSRTLTQTDAEKSDIFNVHAFTDTKLSEQWQLTSGYAYTHVHVSDMGNRLDNASVTSPDTQYRNLSAATALEQYEMNLSLMYSPAENWYIVPAARIEKEGLEGYENTSSTNAVPVITLGSDNESQINIAESLDARYVGITNWVFYARGDWEQNRDALAQSAGTITNTPFKLEILNGAWHQDSQKYSIGANWYPQRGLNFAAQFYHKIDDNSYENNTPINSGAGAFPLSQYPGFMQQENFITDDANFRVTWRPSSQLTLVSRYDFQYSTVDFRGGTSPTGVPLQQIQAANTTIHMFGETLSCTPVNRFYTQLGANYVLNTLHTGAESWLTTGAILKSQNDYWTFNTMMGYGIDDKTDLRLGYNYYRAADYSNNSNVGLPLGAGGEEHTVSATLGRQLRKNLRATVRYGYNSYRDQLFGGHLDYQAHTILASLQYRF